VPQIKEMCSFSFKKSMPIVTSLSMISFEVTKVTVTFLSWLQIHVFFFTVLAKSISAFLPVSDDLFNSAIKKNEAKASQLQVMSSDVK
jgi:hypothetical protein